MMGFSSICWESRKNLEGFPCLLGPTLSNGLYVVTLVVLYVSVECRKVVWGRTGR